MMKRIFIAVLASLPLIAVGQVSNTEMRTMLMANDLALRTRQIQGGSGPAGPMVDGDPYYAPTWNEGSITLYQENKAYNLPAMKYDVLNNSIDILFDPTTFKSLDGSVVQSFEYKDSLTNLPHRFVSGKDYVRDGAPLKGFLEVLCWGKIDVYAYTEASLLRPNYNMAIGSGSKNYTVIKKKILLYSPGTDLRSLNKKELTKIWSEKQAEMTKFQKVNRLSLNRDRDLMLMIDYFNTL